MDQKTIKEPLVNPLNPVKDLSKELNQPQVD